VSCLISQTLARCQELYARAGTTPHAEYILLPIICMFLFRLGTISLYVRSINWQDSATSITPPALRTNNFLMGHVCYHRQRDLRTTTTSTRVARAAHFVFFQIKMPRVGDAASESIGSRSLQCLIFHFSWSDSLDLRASRFSSHGWIIVGFFFCPVIRY